MRCLIGAFVRVYLWPLVKNLLLLICFTYCTGLFAQGGWDPTPYVTDSALIFKDDLDFYLNSYTKEEIKAMRKQVNMKKMTFNKIKRNEIADVRAFSEGRLNDGVFHDFELPLANGGKFNTRQYRGKIMAFMFGSMTCPPTRYQLLVWEGLRKKYEGQDVMLFVVYSRERHAGEKGFREYKYTRSNTDKKAMAAQMAKTTELTVVVDDIDERVLDKYGAVPNAAFVIDKDGTMVFRQTWADSRKIEKVVDRLLLHYENAGAKQ